MCFTIIVNLFLYLGVVGWRFVSPVGEHIQPFTRTRKRVAEKDSGGVAIVGKLTFKQHRTRKKMLNNNYTTEENEEGFE